MTSRLEHVRLLKQKIGAPAVSLPLTTDFPLPHCPPVFCLVMIVRDEAPVIRRCLDSVINLVDCYVICDTGSQDDTVAIIQDYFQDPQHQRPGHLYHKEWQNFGVNKSDVLRLAYEQNQSRNARYLFWLDADEVYQRQDGQYPTAEDAAKLAAKLDCIQDAGIFYFMTHYGNSRYQRWQIVRNNQLFSWRLPVHEYLAPSVPGTRMRLLDDLIVVARKEGNSSRPFSERKSADIRMFEEFLLQPGLDSGDRARATFYLAQSYMDSGNIEKCLEVYEKRLGLGGFNQERFISRLRMARMLRTRQQVERALDIMKPALTEFPGRLEGWLEVMFIYRQKKDWQEAFRTVAGAPMHMKPTAAMLFYEQDVFSYRFMLEAAVTAFYANQFETAVHWNRQLLGDSTVTISDSHLRLIQNNLKVSLDKLAPQQRRQTNVVIVDNFLDSPDQARQFALQQPFEVRGNYPGQRTVSFATEELKTKIEKLLGLRIRGWKTTGYNGAYQLATGQLKSWIHRDLTDYAGVLFLTPGAPAESGTIFYRHKTLGVETENPTNKPLLDADSNDHSKWVETDRVANKYNRLVLFNGRRSHMSGPYFGDSPQTGRLFQTFFFDVDPV